jgi:hypothetical protein
VQGGAGVTWARVGVKCVCITDKWCIPDWASVDRVPMLNEVLTISNVASAHGSFSLQFEEIPETAEDHEGVFFCHWMVECFRPLTTRTQEQDLEHFLPLLRTTEAAH